MGPASCHKTSFYSTGFEILKCSTHIQDPMSEREVAGVVRHWWLVPDRHDGEVEVEYGGPAHSFRGKSLNKGSNSTCTRR